METESDTESDGVIPPVHSDRSDQWLQAHLALFTDPSGVRPSTPWREIARTLDEWGSESYFDRFFFQRKRPGFRARFGGPAVQALSPHLSTWLDGLKRRGVIRGFTFPPYEPETERFGGPAGMAIAHEHFSGDAAAVLRYETLDRRRGSLSRHVISAAICTDLFRKALDNTNEVCDVWADIAQEVWTARASSPTERDDRPSEGRSSDDPVVAAAVELAEPFWSATTPDEAELVRMLIQLNDQTAAKLRAAHKAGRLTVSLRSWLSSLAVFNMNRIGLGLEMEAFAALTIETLSALDCDDRRTVIDRAMRLIRDRKGTRSAAGAEPETVYGAAAHQLAAVCRALGRGREGENFVQLFQEVVSGCDDRRIDLPPRWSGATDDCSPFEISVAIRSGGRNDVRVLFEAQADPPSAMAYWNAGLGVNARLKDLLGVDFSRFELLADLFEPRADAQYAMWHSLELAADGAVGAKLCLNPLAQGVEQAAASMQNALRRLGLDGLGWFSEMSIGIESRPQHFSFRLGPRDTDRIKLYLRCWDLGIDEIETMYAAGRTSVPGDAAAFFTGMTGLPRLSHRPILVAFDLSLHRPERPERVAMLLPAFPYGSNDGETRDRTLAVLSRFGLDGEGYARALTALARRPLNEQSGIHTHISFQRDDGPRITTYFGGRLYHDRFGRLSYDPPRTWPSAIMAAGAVASSPLTRHT